MGTLLAFLQVWLVPTIITPYYKLKPLYIFKKVGVCIAYLVIQYCGLLFFPLPNEANHNVYNFQAVYCKSLRTREPGQR